MCKTVTLTPPQELIVLARNKGQRVLRFNIFVILFFKQCFYEVTGTGIVLVQPHMVLRAVQHRYINMLLIGAPGHGSQVLILRGAGFQEYRFTGSHIIYTDSHLM
ncbi:hypothetical protein D3C86_1194310 [compost metagenome]